MNKVEKMEYALRSEQARLRDRLLDGDEKVANAINTYLKNAADDSKIRLYDILMTTGVEYEVEVNCFKESGKWYAGGKLKVPADAPFWDRDAIFGILAERQDFLLDAAFRNRQYATVLTVSSDYDSDEYCKVIPMSWPALPAGL